MTLELSTWTHHINQLIYSYFYYCKANVLDVNIFYNKHIKYNGGVLTINNTTVFFDYSDCSEFIETPKNYSFYFKRSLLEIDKGNNIYPLNFNLPMSYKSHMLLFKLEKNFLLNKYNRREVIRAIDLFGLFTNGAHSIIDVRKYPKKVKDFGGNIIYRTRLWNPDNHPNHDEKKRRTIQNKFRINACRIIKKQYRNASVGLFSDNLSNKLAPDLVIPSNKSNKKKYLAELSRFNIGIADDGLKNTPGWKIGEYLLHGKAVISTPINTCIDNFEEHINYERLSSRSSYEEIPEKIEYLLKDKKYIEMGENNFEWSRHYLHPKNYIQRILNMVQVNI